VVVLLGSPTEESSSIFAQTVSQGDPTYAGPLAGVELNLPVFHVLEAEVKNQADDEVYSTQVGLMETVLDAAALIAAVKTVRDESDL
jgi:glycine/sarcosine/betaine reductase complex component A